MASRSRGFERFRNAWAAARLLLVVVAALNLLSASAQPCPPGYVIGSTTCVPLNYCPDGRVLVGDDCRGGGAKVSETLVRPNKAEMSEEAAEIEEQSTGETASGLEGKETPQMVDRQQRTILRPKGPLCTPRVTELEKNDERRVLLVGGNAWSLLLGYREEVRLKRQRFDFKQLQVVLVEQDSEERQVFRWGENVRLSLGEMVRGLNPDYAWESVLSNLQAGIIQDPEAGAEEVSADLYCGRTDG